MKMPGLWVDRVRQRRPIKRLILDMDSSVSETYGDQEGTAYNGHFGCDCYHPLVFNQDGDVEYARLRPGNVASADDWRRWPVIRRYRHLDGPSSSGATRRSPSPTCTSCRSRGLPLRHPPQGQPDPRTAHRTPADKARRPPTEEAPTVLRQLVVPGQVVGSTAARRGQDRVAPRRTVPARRIHRDQPDGHSAAGGPLLNQRGTAEQ